MLCLENSIPPALKWSLGHLFTALITAYEQQHHKRNKCCRQTKLCWDQAIAGAQPVEGGDGQLLCLWVLCFANVCDDRMLA
jgi:hypothetical protein